MVSLGKITTRLREIACPICKKSEFVMNPRSSQSYAEDLFTAGCAHCHYTFPVSTRTKPIQQTDPDVAMWLDGLSCPSCEKRGVELDFRCVPSVRDCYYFVTCKTCQHPFYERAPMEAYE